MLKVDDFTVLFSMEVIKHIRNTSGALAVLVGLLFRIFLSECQLIRWIISLEDPLLENSLMITSTVKYKLLRSSFPHKKQRKSLNKGTQRHHSNHRFRFIVILMAIGCQATSSSSVENLSVAYPKFEFRNSVSEGATLELLRPCPSLLSENKSKLRDIAPTKLVVVYIAEELNIEIDSTVRFSSRLFFENSSSNEG